MSSETFPALTDWESTRKTLHLYSHAVGVIPRTHAEFHPKWWHISLNVQPDGLATDEMALPGGGTFSLKINLRNHNIVLSTSRGEEQTFSLAAGTTATALGDQIISAVADLGLSGDYAREKFENDEPRQYDPAQAETFLQALVLADGILKEHRQGLSGEVSPVQLWPHGFDLAFEWYGTRVETYEHEGEMQEYPSQINFGFYPAEPAYFYSNPWPFEEDKLVDNPLPGGANWHLEGWQGTILHYADLVGDASARQRLLAYFGEVYRLAAPTLLV
ncbi:MAG: DUF5996 family protein [Anaerolineae bacterium]